ncbi:uncharacterized protein EAF01_004958 [Botrytis porri]|uniref:uncharacterized protein n=1 Tax=Botrytis porri TaxID=87229 RepID=UPI0018FFCDFA|nr:uncharacterized protein EAF01_004958 [Botrytis porri]KAF7907371.1 hypothetical protein EAF01_004958 [Botrytis porri]
MCTVYSIDNQQENAINPADTSAKPQIIRQHRENRLAFINGDPLPFPNIPYPLEEDDDDDISPNIPPRPMNFHPIPLGPITSQNLHTIPHAFNLLRHYDRAPHLTFPALQYRNRIVLLLNGVAVPWPMHDELPANLHPNFFPDLELSALREIQGIIRGMIRQRSRTIPRARAPNTPSWILGLFPDEPTIGQQDANGMPICPVCFEELPTRVSITRPCGHQFCPVCLEEWIPHAKLMNPPAKCPVCFVEISKIGNNREVGHRVGEFLGWDFEGEGA